MRASNGALAPNIGRVHLDAGRHASPGEGACVVELASLLAREDFSDSPRCVCPVIAAFLRGWNDRAAYAQRQRLRPYAMRIIGTREGRDVTRWRRDLCLAWVGVDPEGPAVSRLSRRVAARARVATFCGMKSAARLNQGAGEYAARVLCGKRDLESAFGLLDALLWVGDNGTARAEASFQARTGDAPAGEIELPRWPDLPWPTGADTPQRSRVLEPV